jgi:hypothetical protein
MVQEQNSPSRRDTRKRAALFLGAAVLLVLVFGIGRVSAPDDEAQSNPPTIATTVPGAELETDYPHSKGGAVVAAAAYQRALANPAILRPDGIKKRIEAIATPDYADEMLEANQPGADRLMAEPIGEGVRRGIPTVYAGVPIAYRVLSYTSDRARIQNWGFTIVGNVSTVEPVAYFGTGTVELAWQDGRWKVASSKAAFGPTPQTRTPEEGAEGFDLQDLADDFRLYGIAP